MRDFSVYKYRSQYDRDIPLLAKGKIYVPTIEKLNDPCEGMYKSKLLQQLQNIGPKADYMINAVEGVFGKKDSLGIYSLSKSYSNELLWAYYADSHKGFCIEYSMSYLLDLYITGDSTEIRFANLLSVEYEKLPPVIDFSDLETDRIDSIILKLLGTKSKNWKGEKEIRVLFESTGETNIDYRAIKSITFGVRAENKTIEGFIKTFPFKIKVYKMKLTNTYLLQREYIGTTLSTNRKYSPKKNSLFIDDGDPEFDKYKKYVFKALKYVLREPYIDDVFYAGIEREKERGKIMIKINATRNKDYSPCPIKFYYFDIMNNRIKYHNCLRDLQLTKSST
jgi:hypothetical protein